MLAVRLPEDIEQRLESLAKKTGRAKSFYVREALSEYLADLEDFYLADKRMKSYSAATAIPLDDLMREYGVDR
ncbi:MAG: ribbon-helix-helix domain-containing protein [Rubrivivax sp.]